MLKFNITENSGTAIYIQLKNEIKAAIKSGEIPPMSKLPSVSEIAETAGVSLRTADIALKELIREGICFRRPKKGTFAGSDMVYDKHRICGICSNLSFRLPHPYPMYHCFYSGIAETAADIGIETVVMNNDIKKFLCRYEKSQEFDFRGIVAFDFDKFDILAALARDFPHKKFFYLNYCRNNFDIMPENMYAVINDDFKGAYRLVEHFISEQSEKFMILSQKLPGEDYTYKERVRGFLKGMEDYSSDGYDDVIETACGQDSKQQVEYAFLAVKKALRRGQMPDTILCTNDFLALGALRAAQSEKADIMIAGYDGAFQNLFGDLYFTTTKVDFYEMARQALMIMEGKLEAVSNLIKILPEIQIANRKGVMYA